MRLIAPLLAWLVLGTPAFAQEAAHHDAQVSLDPARGTVQIEDHIRVSGQGRATFALSPVFIIQSVTVDGRPQDTTHQDGRMRIDLGPDGTHDVRITTQATLTHQSQPLFLTAEGGFLGGNWLAHPVGHLATWVLNGETPSGQKWLTAGRLSAEDDAQDHYRARFTERRPSPPPILITGPFTITEHPSAAVRVRTYFHDELAPLAGGYLQDAAAYIQRYVQSIGPYPYDGFSIVSGVAPVGLGLPGMTYMGRRVLALPFIRTSSLPHEVLHNWWGNAVDVDYARGNWSEGLTTYLADHALAPRNGQDMRLEWLRNYAALPANRDEALTSFTSRTHDASQVVGYGKTAMVFHMLKMRVGDKAFTAALRDFYKTMHSRTAGWGDLQSAFEAASGQNLAAFFKAWVTRPGAPSLTLNNAHVEAQRTTFTLTQTQDGDVYPLTVPVHVDTPSGTQRFTVHMEQKSQAFTLDAKGKISALRIDPKFDVFRRLSLAETPAIFRDVTLNSRTRLLLPGTSAAAKSIARQLAARLLQRDVRESDLSLPLSGLTIVAGLDADVMAALTQSGFGPLPKAVATHSAARAFVRREGDGRTTLVVMAQDEESLARLARALPHYKGRSYVVLEAGKISAKGVWHITESPLARTFP